MSANFPLFSNPVHLAHLFWQSLLKKDDIVVDATLGNGKDALFLSQILLKNGGGTLHGLDIQKQALENTSVLLEKNAKDFLSSVHLFQRSHESFPELISKGSVKLVVYNLGYLPGSDKTITTMTDTTLLSIKNALELITPSGAISITCYPGHREGQNEFLALESFANMLDKSFFCVTSHTWLNRQSSPILIFIQKAK